MRIAWYSGSAGEARGSDWRLKWASDGVWQGVSKEEGSVGWLQLAKLFPLTPKLTPKRLISWPSELRFA